MAEDSSSRVTITLGRSGQVVKRPGLVMDESSVSYSHPSVGSKRSILDRLGNYADHDVPLSKKRKRQIQRAKRSGQLFLSADSDSDDVTLTKDDLRFKIMRKSSSQSSIQQKGADLRDLLSRSSTTILPTRQHTPVLRDNRDQLTEPRHARPQMAVLKNTDRQLLTECSDGRQKLPELRDSRHVMPDRESTKYSGQGPNGSSSFLQIRPSSSMKALPNTDSLRRSYSPWTLDNVRRRSPDRLLGTSRGLSPPKRNDEPDRRPLPRSYDDSRASSLSSKYPLGLEHSNPMNPSVYAAKAAQTAVAAKKVLPPVTQLPSSAGLMQRPSYAVESVDAFLHSLGLDKYCINFKAEEVDMYALRQMGDSDLKELGIPMGPRKKILLTMLSQSKRQL